MNNLCYTNDYSYCFFGTFIRIVPEYSILPNRGLFLCPFDKYKLRELSCTHV